MEFDSTVIDYFPKGLGQRRRRSFGLWENLIGQEQTNIFNMSILVARTGRHRQRYVDQFRLVAGCIPYKLEENVEVDQSQSGNVDSSRVLVLMISTPKRDDLVFPKGGWEDDETLDQAASREALEEAGVHGILGDSPLGVWEFRSKSSQSSCSSGGGCRGYMFALEVLQELDHWPGQACYSRKWLPVDQAFKLCRYDWMRDALERFVAALPKDRTVKTRELPVDVTVNIGVENQPVSPRCSLMVSGPRKSPIITVL